MVKKIDMTIFNTLEELLSELADYHLKFCDFAAENERAVKLALYAESVLAGYATPSELLVSECEKLVPLFKTFLSSIENEEE